MICFPNTKINLGLHVINKRADGFHNIETIFLPIPFGDMLEVIKNNSTNNSQKVTLLYEGLKIDVNADENLIVKGYNLLDKEFNLDPATFFLYKKIPMGAGLGGGSADAAFALKLLNDLFELNLSIPQLKNYAAQLGSDCAFFIENKPAYVFGRGFELETISLNLSSYYIALLYPNVHSSTALAYKGVTKRELFDEQNSLKKWIQLPVQDWKQYIQNDFESSVFKAIPQLPTIKQQLYNCGALYASMSGSGSAMFGIFDSQPKLTSELEKMVCYYGEM
jgi:4-diphosphocytidyl-2-C-methyl-D-erythritol kinase